MRRVVYVAGPYRAASPWEVEHNVRRAEELALEVWRAGAAAVCPHTMTRFYSGALGEEDILDGLLAVVERCDAVLLLPGWSTSPGTRAERELALRRGIPVFTELAELRRWLED